MKKSVLTLAMTLASITASAQVPSVVKKVAADIKISDTRTLIKEVTNEDGNPCMPEGLSYLVEVQVKNASWNGLENKVEYSWETVKTVGVDKQGRKMEVCAE